MVVIRGGVHPLNNIPTVGTSIQWGNIIHTNIIVTVGSSSIHPLNKFPTVGYTHLISFQQWGVVVVYTQ